jgi:hypothetical protein
VPLRPNVTSSTAAVSVEPGSILSIPTSTNAEIAPAGAMNVSLVVVQTPEVVFDVRMLFAPTRFVQIGPPNHVTTVSAHPVVVSPSANFDLWDSV